MVERKFFIKETRQENTIQSKPTCHVNFDSEESLYCSFNLSCYHEWHLMNSQPPLPVKKGQVVKKIWWQHSQSHDH